MLQTDHEQVVSAPLPHGARCHIAIHSTVRGPSLGGVRLMSYADDSAALADALALSEAMTYKAAAANLPVGGGKAVVDADPGAAGPELFRALGEVINELGGRYIAACDMNVSPADLRPARAVSPWVRGLPRADGGSGDSSEMTAYGVLLGIRAALFHREGTADLAGRRVGIDGTGKVGGRLAALLGDAGAEVTVSDIDPPAASEAARRCGGTVVDREALYRRRLDVLSPNATGATLDPGSVSGLRCRVVAGAANNQLATPSAGADLADRGILFAPDFVVNAGGLIQVVDELHEDGPSVARAREATEMIPGRLLSVFRLAERSGVPTAVAAMAMARGRLGAAVAGERSRGYERVAPRWR